MKNTSRFLPIICMAFLASNLTVLSGCSNKSKVGLIYGDYRTETITNISYLQLSTKIQEEENFLLSIEPTSYCACWRDFKLVAENYIKNNHVIIYRIKINEFGEDKFGLNLKEGYTSFAIFENGKVVRDVASDNGQILKDDSEFAKYMEDNVTLPTMFYVSLDQVNEMYISEQNSAIYFSRSNCPDCTYVDRYFLKDYSLSNRNTNKLYILDCESIGIRKYDEEGNLTPESAVLWQNFKDDYGLSNKNNSKFGFDTGFVPTFFLLNKNQYLSGAVYFNDTLVEDGSSYKIESTYYSQNRMQYLQYLDSSLPSIEGMQISSDQVGKIGNYVYWKQDCAAKTHNKYLEKFLNYSLPLVSYNIK